MTSRTATRSTFHHGDLSRSLLDLAMTHVRAHGADSFSLREAARDAGVTVGAVYKHYPDKDALLSAVAHEGFRRLALATAVAASNKTPQSKLLCVGTAYVEFASRERHLFQLMFSPIGMKVARKPFASDPPVAGAFDQLRAAIEDTQRSKARRTDESLLALAWSVAHGAASLISDGVWKRDDPRAHAALQKLAELFTTE